MEWIFRRMFYSWLRWAFPVSIDRIVAMFLGSFLWRVLVRGRWPF